MNPNPYDWTPGEVEAAKRAYDAAPADATKAELQALMDAARAEVRAKPCKHRRITHTSQSVQCTDCGAPIDTGCEHRHIDNETGRCTACGEQMISQHVEPETVLSAPNAAACTNPACLKAMEDGTYDETNPPAGCTNPSGVYIEDRSRAKTVILGYNVTYECERCGNDGTIIDSYVVTWECGKVHRGDYISAREEVKA